MLNTCQFENLDIPEDVLHKIFSYLNIDSVFNFHRTNSNFYKTTYPWVTLFSNIPTNQSKIDFKNYIQYLLSFPTKSMRTEEVINREHILSVLKGNVQILNTIHLDWRPLLYSLRFVHNFYMQEELKTFDANALFPEDIEKTKILYSLIRIAVTKNQLGLLEYIMNADFKITEEQKNELIKDAFKLAAQNGYLESVRLLAKYPTISVNIQKIACDELVFMRAAKNGHLPILEFFCKKTEISYDCMEYALSKIQLPQHREIHDFLMKKMQPSSKNCIEYQVNTTQSYTRFKQSTSSSQVGKTENNITKRQDKCLVM